MASLCPQPGDLSSDEMYGMIKRWLKQEGGIGPLPWKGIGTGLHGNGPKVTVSICAGILTKIDSRRVWLMPGAGGTGLLPLNLSANYTDKWFEVLLSRKV